MELLGGGFVLLVRVELEESLLTSSLRLRAQLEMNITVSYDLLHNLKEKCVKITLCAL